ncbi:MAG: hypothetical protein OEY14_07185, partial [Myxococcales bacterium]|nr:hypothetical protein [Myxococcales bacterium]
QAQRAAGVCAEAATQEARCSGLDAPGQSAERDACELERSRLLRECEVSRALSEMLEQRLETLETLEDPGTPPRCEPG